MSRTQVTIVGAGPAGLMLGHLLHQCGIETVILENQSREHVVERVRAGVLEQGTVDLMVEAGVGDRVRREGMRHGGVHLAFNGRRHYVDFDALTGGRAITIYGQNEVVRDLLAVREADGAPARFQVRDVRLSDLDSMRPRVTFVEGDGGDRQEIVSDFIAGCDGYHGVSRPSIPVGQLRTYERTYPFGWLGILANAAPSCDALVYALHERGFALFSMRSPSVTRLYLQCAPDDDVAAWSDDRIWSELRTRLGTEDGWRPNEGEITQKGVTGMRSFVAEPMRYGRLFLAGDAAHIVPPTGAKGLNLAMADVRRLARAFEAFYRSGDQRDLNRYSERGLRRAWNAQRFSWWMTSMLHRQPDGNEFDDRRQLADLEYLIGSPAALTSLAESYVGLPFD